MTAHNRWPVEQEMILCRMFTDGAVPRAIADRLGVTKNMVIGKLYRMYGRTSLTPYPQRWTDEQETVLRRMVIDGATPHDITNRLGVTQERVRRKLYLMYGSSVLTSYSKKTQRSPVAYAYDNLPPGRYCCWPIGDPKKLGFRFCGASGYPYCDEHKRISQLAAA